MGDILGSAPENPHGLPDPFPLPQNCQATKHSQGSAACKISPAGRRTMPSSSQITHLKGTWLCPASPRGNNKRSPKENSTRYWGLRAFLNADLATSSRL